MADQTRWLGKIINRLKRQGWEFSYRGKHVIAYPADKSKGVFTISVTPSDRYGQAQAKRDLCKAGARADDLK
jgi:hypothetical protein